MLNSNSAEAHNNLWILYEIMKEYDKSIEEFRKAADLDPLDAHNHFNLALSYRRKGDIQEAIREYDTALALSPDFNEAYDNLNVLYTLCNGKGG